MNNHLKSRIGMYISVGVNFIADGSKREEYIQGKLKDVKGDVLVIEQFVPFRNLFIKDSEVLSIIREISIQSSIQGSIRVF